MFRFRWIRRLFPHSKFSPTPKASKVVRPSFKPRLESLEERALPSANPLSQMVAAAPTAHVGSSTAGASKDVASPSSGDVIALAHAVLSEADSTLHALFARALTLANGLWSSAGMHGLDAISAGQTAADGMGSGSGGNGIASSLLEATTAAKGSGHGTGISSLPLQRGFGNGR